MTVRSRALVSCGIVAAAVVTMTLAPRPALAVERQWHLGAGLGPSLLDVDDKSTVDIGAGLGLDISYGLTDQFNLVGELQTSRVASGNLVDSSSTPHTRPTGLTSAAVGATYVFDVLRWVPYAGILVGGDVMTGGTLDGALALPTAQLAVGVDYQLDRTWSIGLAGRQHVYATHTSTYPSLTTVFARVEYAWGW